MSEDDFEISTNVSWRPTDYRSEPLRISDWIAKNGWDFVGCVVDIQLRKENGDYFFVKLTGSVEGIEKDTAEDWKEGDRTIYHLGISKTDGTGWIFRNENIHVIRNHFSSRLEKQYEEEGKTVFPFKQEDIITKDILAEKAENEVGEVGLETACCM
tara:strand:- start:2551 stop:3018 length:468 start_codon:yes stop_codon:yes gene_type:complete